MRQDNSAESDPSSAATALAPPTPKRPCSDRRVPPCACCHAPTQPSSSAASPSFASVFAFPTPPLAARFHVAERALGTGQFGVVRECVDSLTGEALACKTLKKQRLQLEAQRDEVRSEVLTMMRVAGHDNIVQLRGVFEEPQEVHLVMDLCPGGELFDEVHRRQCFSERDAALVFAQVVRAVAYCHSRGVCHRDLKPENILLSPSSFSSSSAPHVKLADFGLAVVTEPGKKLHGMAGSPFYMAPEILAGEYDSKVDVWALGVILYILLSGSPPFWGDSDKDVFASISNGVLDFSFSPWHRVSAEAKSLVRCLLNRDPELRPSAARILTHPWLLLHAASAPLAARSTAPAAAVPVA